LNSHQISGQATDDQNPSEGGIEAQEEVQNQDLLSPSSSSLVIRPITEDVVTPGPGDVTSGSAVIDQHVKDSVEDFWRFHLKWINNAAQEVCFFLLSGNL
jgi:hypothetical protein